jgi:hypothetical protein
MSPDEREGLRAMVREAIREALAERRGVPSPPGAASGGEPPASARSIVVEPVRLASDADLAVFVRRLAGLLRDPAAAARIEDGSHRFTFAGTGHDRGSTVAQRDGLVTERAVDALPEGAVLRLAPGAVVTPLAKDRARQRRIKLERGR